MEGCKSQVEIKHSFANFCVYLLKESITSRQDLDKLMTNIPQLTEYGNFCRIISTPIKYILESYCHLGLLFLNGTKMSKNCRFQ